MKRELSFFVFLLFLSVIVAESKKQKAIPSKVQKVDREFEVEKDHFREIEASDFNLMDSSPASTLAPKERLIIKTIWISTLVVLVFIFIFSHCI